MGRTSKFSFPVPGKRRDKHQPQHEAIVSSPMTKAQRILGAAELNIDAHRPWESSNAPSIAASGISVSVSDHSTATYKPTDRGNGHGTLPLRDANRWEMESETMPAHLQVHPDMSFRDHTSDASSMRRRQSSSTLKSWYEKSKVPLSISQQTSSSAMAKGPPSKAHALLDVDSSDAVSIASFQAHQAQNHKLNKRPSRLNLAHLFTGSGSSTGSGRRDSLQPSPSSGSLRSPEWSPGMASSTFSHETQATTPRTPRRLQKQPTREKLAEAVAAAASTSSTNLSQMTTAEEASPPPAPLTRKGTGSSGGSGQGLNPPRDLYDHYERTAFRNVLESPDEEAEDPLDDVDKDEDLYDEEEEEDDEEAEARLMISDFPMAPVGPTPLRSPSHPRRSMASDAAGAAAGQKVVINEPEYDNDYDPSLASVSSRHTKTSKASKSVSESDRQERSVLSLSSDSEEDDEDFRVPPAPRSQSQSDAPTSPASLSRKSLGSRGESISDTGSRKSGKRASFAPVHTYLTVPAGGSSPAGATTSTSSGPILKPMTFNPRTSSRNRGMSATSTTNSSGSNNTRTSPVSAASSNASLDWPIPSRAQQQQSSSYGVQEANLHDTTKSSYSYHKKQGKHHPQLASLPNRTSLRDQPTPPLSPSSVEFCLQPDMSFDVSRSTTPAANGSTNKDMNNIDISISIDETTSSGANSTKGMDTDSDAVDSPLNPRFMAVTHQEQLLLAALRNKRAMMREGNSAHAEYEADTDAPPAKTTATYHKHTSSQTTIRGPSPVRVAGESKFLRHQGSSTSNNSTSTITEKQQQLQYTSDGKLAVVAPHGKAASDSGHRTRASSRGARSDHSSPAAPYSHGHHHPGHRAKKPSSAASSFTGLFSEVEQAYAPREATGGGSSTRRHVADLAVPAAPRSSSKASSTRRAAVESEDSMSTLSSSPASKSSLAVPGQAEVVDRKKAARLSAVGLRAGPEVGWWGDDG